MKEDSSQVVQQFSEKNPKLHTLDSGIKDCLGNQVIRDTDNNISHEGGQLIDILESSHISAVLKAHDGVATLTHQRSDSRSIKSQAEDPDTDQSEKSSIATNQSTLSKGLTDVYKVETSLSNDAHVKVITLHKNAEPLGATVRSEGNSIVVARIIEGGMADRTKLLKRGDELLEVNDTDIKGKTVDEVADLMMSLTGDVKLVTRTASSAHIGVSNRHMPRRKITVRAQFDYDAPEDSFIPCVELGLSFQIGDVLQIINRDDPHWWQALREDDEPCSLAGLIPSRLFWETREEVRRAILAESDANIKKKRNGKLNCCRSLGSRKGQRKMSIKHDSGSSDLEAILTYEEVGPYYPEPHRKRPIVLVGCEELRLHKFCEKIVSVDNARFSQPIRTTSLPATYTSGKHRPLEYLQLDKFIEKIKGDEFVEHKVADEPEFHYVGVSKQAVTDIVEKGVTCIMHCQPKNINRIRTKEFKPYIVFVAAPPIQRLRDFLRSESTIDPSNDECKHIIDLSRHHESTYSYLYDYVMTVRSIEKAVEELMSQINLLDNQQQWVPIDWLPTVDGKTNSNYVRDPDELSAHDSNVSVNSHVTKQSVVVDVEPAPSDVVTQKSEGQPTSEQRIHDIEHQTDDEIQLISLDSSSPTNVGEDKWVEFL
ncbi:protein PALS1-like isoform X2 [Watersipora subatra]